MAMGKEEQAEYRRNFNKQNYKRFSIYVSYYNEMDIINKLSMQENVNSYIKNLIREDIKKEEM